MSATDAKSRQDRLRAWADEIFMRATQEPYTLESRQETVRNRVAALVEEERAESSGDLHEMRVALMESGWTAQGKPQDRLRIILREWRAAEAGKREAREVLDRIHQAFGESTLSDDSELPGMVASLREAVNTLGARAEGFLAGKREAEERFQASENLRAAGIERETKGAIAYNKLLAEVAQLKAERREAKKLLDPKSNEETLCGAIRNVMQAYVSEADEAALQGTEPQPETTLRVRLVAGTGDEAQKERTADFSPRLPCGNPGCALTFETYAELDHHETEGLCEPQPEPKA